MSRPVRIHPARLDGDAAAFGADIRRAALRACSGHVLVPCCLAAILALAAGPGPAAAALGEPERLSEHFELVPDSPALQMTTYHHVWRTTPGAPRRHLAASYSIRKPLVSSDGRRCLVYGEVDEDLLPGRSKPADRRGIWVLDADGRATRLRRDHEVDHSLTSLLPSAGEARVLRYVADSRFDPRGWIRVSTAEGVDTIDVLLDASEAHRVALLGTGRDIETLRSQGAPLDESGAHGWTPLELAIVAGNDPVAAALCSLGVASARGFSRALALSVRLGRAGVLRALARHGADVHGADSLGAGLLHYAVEPPEGLRSPTGPDPRERLKGFLGLDGDRIPPRDYLACVAALLELGADPRAAGRDGATPLHRLATDSYVHYDWKRREWAAAGELSAGAAGMLLASGADANARDASGCTPLHALLERQRFDYAVPILDTLFVHGADVDATCGGLTALERIFQKRVHRDESPSPDDWRTAAWLAAHGARLDRLVPEVRRRVEARLRRGSPGAWAP